MGYRAGSEEVVVMDASSVYVASIFLSAYTGGSCSHMSGIPYAFTLQLLDSELRQARERQGPSNLDHHRESKPTTYSH
jgi:hypothetical protein